MKNKIPSNQQKRNFGKQIQREEEEDKRITLIVQSSLPVTNNGDPERALWMVFTIFICPVIFFTLSPVSKSHTIALWSALHEYNALSSSIMISHEQDQEEEEKRRKKKKEKENERGREKEGERDRERSL